VKAALALALVLCAVAEDRREAPLGRSARIEDLVLPGGELAAAPADARAALVVRITAVRPHGGDFRYDLEWTAFEAGEHDLATQLVRRDGTPAGLAPIPVRATSALPTGQVLPHPPAAGELPRLGGYRLLAWLAGAAWLVGLIALLLAGRRRRRAAARAAERRPATLAERLAPLVERAARGELSSAERAQLEASLYAYWRRRLALESERPERAQAALRAHPDAGPLLASLEEWLHRPAPRERVDVARLLAPYKNLPPDALEAAAPAG
jgi:hypothetical protein